MKENAAAISKTYPINQEVKARKEGNLMLVGFNVKQRIETAKRLLNMGKLEAAIEALTEAIDRDMDDTLAYQSYYNRGILYERIGQEDKAIEDFRTAAELGNTKAQKLLEEKEKFEGSIAHRLNNLLMVIEGNLSLVLQNIGESHPARKNLKNIEKQVEDGIKISGELLCQQRNPHKPQEEVPCEEVAELKAADTGASEISKTVLVVDDDPLVLDTTVQMLQALGYHVLSAETADKALDIYHAYKREIDLMVTDVVMPRMDGGELYREIKQINPGARVLLMSGYDKDHRARELLGPDDDFIQKPFDLKEISSKVQSMFDK